jgi:hypothetical protein
MEASLIFGFVIFANSFYIGFEVDNRPKQDTTGVWFFVDNVFTLTFIFELLLRFRAEGLRTLAQRWNQFDALMVAMAILDTYVVPNVETGLGQGNLRMFSMLRMLRLLKILRVIRLLRMFSDLWIMCLSLWHGLQSLAWLAVLIFFFIYTIGLVMTRLIGKQYGLDTDANDAEVELYWGTVPSSLLSLFIVMTGEDWVTIAATAERHQLWTRFLFVFFIGVTNLALLNLITGVIIDKVFTTKEETEMETELAYHDPAEEFKQLKRVFEKIQNMNGKVDQEVLAEALAEQNGPLQTTLRNLDVFLGADASMLFNVLDVNDSGAVSLDEFVNGITRMKGSTQSKHMFFVHSDLHTISKRVFGAVDATHLTSARQLDCTEHMETLVRDMWILMQKQATNRWSSDPFHSSLHQMVGNIHELVAEMGKKNLGADAIAANMTPRVELPREDTAATSFWSACTPVRPSAEGLPSLALDRNEGVDDVLNEVAITMEDPLKFAELQRKLNSRFKASPLRKAVRANRIDDVKLLLDQKAELQETDPYWMLTLLDETRPGSELALLLSERGAKHSLFFAASQGNLDLTKRLVAERCDVNASNYAGWRVADFAARSPLIRQVLERAEHEGVTLQTHAKLNGWVDPGAPSDETVPNPTANGTGAIPNGSGNSNPATRF